MQSEERTLHAIVFVFFVECVQFRDKCAHNYGLLLIASARAMQR